MRRLAEDNIGEFAVCSGNRYLIINFVQNLLRKEAFSEKRILQVRTSDAKLFLIKLQGDGKRHSSIKAMRGVLRISEF